MSKSSKRKAKKSRTDNHPCPSKDPLFVGIITKAQILKMEKRSRRECAIEAGEYTRSGSGSGAHGGNKRQLSKRNRQQAKQSLAKASEL